jgi:hypothetical protein
MEQELRKTVKTALLGGTTLMFGEKCMKTNKLYGMLILIISIILAFSFTACGDGNGDDNNDGKTPPIASFAGTWNASGGRSVVFTGNNFNYKVNGTTQYSGTFSVSGSTITFTISSGTASGNFTLSGTTLTLSNHTWDNSVNGTYTKDSGSGGGGSTVLDGAWRRGSDTRYYQFTLDGSNWVYSEGPAGSVAEFSKGTWTSSNTIAAGSTGTLTLTVTHIKSGSSWANLPSEYNSVKTNTATYQLNASANQLTISNPALTTSGVWGTLAGVYTKQTGSGGNVVDPALVGKWEWEKVIVSGTQNNLPWETVTSGGYVFTSNNFTSYVNGSQSASYSAYTANNTIYSSSGQAGYTYSITGGNKLTAQAADGSSGIIANKVTTFSWEGGSIFVAVTNITNVPTAATAGTTLALTSTVEPSNATNKTIVWSVVSGSATVNGSTLNPTAAGTVTVRATITNGTAQGTNYTKDFNITVSAAGIPFPANGTLAEKLTWVKNESNVQNGETYTLEVNANESIAPQTLSYTYRNNITIILKGIGTEKFVSLSSNGSLFTVESGATLVLDNNITLQGGGSNTAALVRVNGGGTLIMETGAKITGNTSSANNSATGGGGVLVSGGTFTMNGGKISSNKVSSYGGGVLLDRSGSFTMNSGEISDNTSSGDGGGMSLFNSSTFIMNGGEISRNATNTSSGGGGGVYVNSGTFTMNSGEISSNTAYTGGGVRTFNGAFFMNGGEISGNTGSYSGGVYNSGTFTMNNGEISGNTGGLGGGVLNSGTFRIITGTIYGSEAAAGAKKNTANSGAALHFDSTYPNSTAQRGTFSGTTWTSKATLSTTNNTINVVNGDIAP